MLFGIVMEELNEEVVSMFEQLLKLGEDLLTKLNEDKIHNLKGICKLERKIKKDITFLSDTFERKTLKREHLTCTNLHFFKALVEETLKQSDCLAVLDTFSFKEPDGSLKRITVDIVSQNGQNWIKVIARNPAALHQMFREGDTFGRRSILDQGKSYLKAATQNLNLYCIPQVEFLFVNGVPEVVKVFLEKKGIKVCGKVIVFNDPECSPDTSSDSDHDSDSEDDDLADYIENQTSEQATSSSNLINLCVTTMIAYVSELTNGGCNSSFVEPILNQQAEWERNNPVKQSLTKLFQGKELICCQTAVEDFKNIVEMVGGENEKKRATELLSVVRVVPDVVSPGLNLSGKVKGRSRLIFGTGQEHKAITVTANKGFVHASKHMGVAFAVVIHESRALTERKQLPKET